MVRRVLILVAAVLLPLAGTTLTAPVAAAGQVVTDYQDPLQALPSVSRPPTRSCTVTAMQHVFANSYGQPYVGTLAPPAGCAGAWNKVVLDWTASSKGRQFDRLAGLWIAGAEVLRTSTPEPDPSGITWHFDRDITEFAPLMHRPQPFVVDLGNIVNDTYTGPYDVTVTVTYYMADHAHPAPKQADVVVPLAADPAQPGWQFLTDGHNYVSKVAVPRHTARLSAEIYARGGGCEEFWWSNVPTDIATGNPGAGLCGGGTYREVRVKIDGVPAGVVLPYPVIYTGGVAPMLWRPISAVDAIVTLPYTIDLTPFVGTLTDGATHTIELVPPKGIVDNWTLGGNLFATTDPHVPQVTGKMLHSDVAADAAPSTKVTGTGLDVSITTSAHRQWHTEGLLFTSDGPVFARASGQWSFDNTTSLAEGASKQQTRQHAVGAYEHNSWALRSGPSSARDGFDFTVNADVTQAIVDDNNYRIDAQVHLGRILRTDVGALIPNRTVTYSDDGLDSVGGFGRAGGVLNYADGHAAQRWRGLDDAGRCYDHTLAAEHGWITKDAVNARPCGGHWPG
jgi:hypothetical protein